MAEQSQADRDKQRQQQADQERQQREAQEQGRQQREQADERERQRREQERQQRGTGAEATSEDDKERDHGVRAAAEKADKIGAPRTVKVESPESRGREYQAERANLPPVQPEAANQPSRGTDEFTDPVQKLRANPHVLPTGNTADGNSPSIMGLRAQEAPRVVYDEGYMGGPEAREWIVDQKGGMRRMTDEDVAEAKKQDTRSAKKRSQDEDAEAEEQARKDEKTRAEAEANRRGQTATR